MEQTITRNIGHKVPQIFGKKKKNLMCNCDEREIQNDKIRKYLYHSDIMYVM